MPIEFRCVQCNKLLRTPDETAGGQARCPDCGGVTEIPQSGQPQVNPFEAPQNAPSAPTSFSQAPAGAYIPNYLAQAILCMLFCCFPLGVVAIVFAAQVNSSQMSGNTAAAVDASEKAKMLCWVSFWAGLVGYVGVFLILCAGLAA